MKKITLLMLIILSATMAFAQYKPKDEGSSVQFAIKNFGFDVQGKFTGLQGDIKFDPANSNNSSFDITIDAATVNTDNSLRDRHLQGDTYFDIKNYPKIHLISTKVAAGGKSGTYTLTGKLTIKKTTKTISFPFTAIATNDGYQFKGTFKINRKDYEVGGTSTIADDLDVTLNIIAIKG